MRWFAAAVLALALAVAPAADAKTRTVDWHEQVKIPGGVLRFHITRIATTTRTWSVTISIENASAAAVSLDPAGNIPVGPSPNAVWRGGVALLEYHRVYTANVAGIIGEWWQHPASTRGLPRSLAAHRTWRGAIGGTAKLRPKQAYHLGLGAFTSADATGGGKPLVWITDHSFTL
jgi:hypothetical protein